MTHLIDAASLAAALTASTPPRVLDVRWKLGGPPGAQEYAAGHIPEAVYVDLDTELAGHGLPTDGRHPLPTPEDFQDAVRGWGLNDGDEVVVYDDVSGTSAARAWWLLRHAGFASVRVLDGGLAAWRAAGGALETAANIPERGTATVAYGALPTIDADSAAGFPAAGVLLDARAGERFRGEVEPVDPRAGHIPGAVSAPTTENLAADGMLLPADVLADRFAALGVTQDAPVAVYCGSGVTAAHEILALEVAGFRAALYPGSFSAWSNDAQRPVAMGA
ncbi:thiosulfate sulfurtransferase [Leifsonia sp. Root227]|uniref:sulfurtransferase n=1 Tax=Leifsonia sp. Root227 TaxID=1736496 RepID=UPI0006F35B6A|nr:sulfurtransferase [Leifsonia sp. Root227]KRC49539.1 thiosulfate sulfurtransferase [Leifsonia sp. Root227]